MTEPVRLLYGMDVRAGLQQLAAESVHCVVTSPPYWGLRAYGTEPQIWDADEPCQHQWQTRQQHLHAGRGDAQRSAKYSEQPSIPDQLITDAVCVTPHEYQWLRGQPAGYRSSDASAGPLNKGNLGSGQRSNRWSETCGCGAWKGELGLEPTPELYVQHVVTIFREVRRVLRSDGSCWLNLGDSYWGGKGQSAHGGSEKQRARFERNQSLNREYQEIGEPGWTKPGDGKHSLIKPKDLVGIPWRVTFALQADGWWLRSDIIWAKPTPMPESVQDRPTRSHEYLFLLTKSRHYFYDALAIAEVRDTVEGRSDRITRNKRSVWWIRSQPYPEAHFATFPPALVEPWAKWLSSLGGRPC